MLCWWWRLTQGCNCALESARVLAETLDKVGLERLDKLPAAYSAARVKDAHAAQDMDFNMAVRRWHTGSRRQARKSQLLRATGGCP